MMKPTNEIKILRMCNGWLVQLPGPAKTSNDWSEMMSMVAASAKEFIPIIMDALGKSDDQEEDFPLGKGWSGSVPRPDPQPGRPADQASKLDIDQVISEDMTSFVFADFIGVLAFLQKIFSDVD